MIYEKLSEIQAALKAPKSQRNTFGKYNYRSCEDILEAVKPYLTKYKVALIITDEIVPVEDRVYVKASATLYDAEDGTKLSTTAYAREASAKKGMDESQITGSASSYARKYALNGLLAIDDTKDADTMDNREKAQKSAETSGITNAQQKRMFALLKESGKSQDTLKMYLKQEFGIDSTKNIRQTDYQTICEWIQS